MCVTGGMYFNRIHRERTAVKWRLGDQWAIRTVLVGDRSVKTSANGRQTESSKQINRLSNDCVADFLTGRAIKTIEPVRCSHSEIWRASKVKLTACRAQPSVNYRENGTNCGR